MIRFNVPDHYLKASLYFFLLGVFLLGGTYLLSQAKFRVITYISYFTIWLGLGFLSLSFFYLIFFVLKINKELKNNILLSLYAVFIVLILFEIGLRVSGKFHTYNEKSWGGKYLFLNKSVNTDSWFFLHTPNTTIDAGTQEFKYYRSINALGLPEKEIPAKEEGEIRILALGDSFTEGVGVPFDSTWVKKLPLCLNKNYKDKKITTINAGVGGSDLAYTYLLYKEKLLNLESDIVIFFINTSDVHDFALRGGLERFQPDGTVRIESPWWEWLFSSSHIVRFYFRYLKSYSGNLKPYQVEKSRRQLFSYWGLEIVEKIRSVALEKQARIIFVSHPLKTNYKYPIVRNPLVRFMDSLEQKQIPTLQIKDSFDKKGDSTVAQISKYFWPIDQHFNQKGNDFVSQAICDEIIRLGWVRNE